MQSGTISSEAMLMDDWVDNPLERIGEAVRVRPRQRWRWRSVETAPETGNLPSELNQLMGNSANVQSQSHRPARISPSMSSAAMIEAHLRSHRNQEQPSPVIDDRDSFSSIAAINSESQMDTAAEIDSMVALSISSSRRRSDSSRVSDVDTGDSRAPRRRRLN